MIYDDLLGIEFERNTHDCKWLCGEVYRRLGKKVPDWDTIVEDWSPEGLSKVVEKHRSKFRVIGKPEPYCIVSFFIKPFYTTHIGVVLEDCQKFIHILKASRVTVERLDRPEWKNRITGYYIYE